MALPPQLQRFFERPELRRYQPVGEPRWGGMGAVVKVYDSQRDKALAMKILYTESDNNAERFQREIRVLQKLKHPGIVEVLDWGVGGAYFFYIMGWIEGRSLQELVDESFRSTGQAIDSQIIQRLFIQLAKALDHCHCNGIIHRDLKPENIMVTNNNDSILIDFGLAHLSTEDLRASFESVSPKLTNTGEFLGTPAFMSPEQLDHKGEMGDISAKTDVWGLGASLFYTLTGSPLFDSQSATELFINIINVDPDYKKLLDQRAHKSFAKVTQRCLKKKQSERPTLSSFISELENPNTENNNALKLGAIILLFVLILGLSSLFIGSEDGRIEFSQIESSAGLLTQRDTVTISGVIKKANVVVKVNSTRCLSNEQGQFQAEIALEEGVNDIVFETPKRSFFPKKISIFRDLSPPDILVTNNGESNRIDTTELQISGTVFDNHSIGSFTINDVKVPLDSQQFIYPLRDSPRPIVLNLKATDSAGNICVMTCNVFTPLTQKFKKFSGEHFNQLDDFLKNKVNSESERQALLNLCTKFRWANSPETLQDQGVAVIARRLGARFKFKETVYHQCGKLRFRIATFTHRKTGVDFQLIPGSLKKITWWRKPLFEQAVRYSQVLANNNFDIATITAALAFPPSDEFVTLIQKALKLKKTGRVTFPEAYQSLKGLNASQRKRFRATFATLAKEFIKGAPRKAIIEYIPPFLIAKRELSLKQWRTTLPLPPAPTTAFGATLDWTSNPHFPVSMSHKDALTWLAKADEHFRLPSRQEWMTAAAGGSRRLYFCGDKPSRAKHFSNLYSDVFSLPVGTLKNSKKCNAFGLSDVYGNVSEWADPSWDSWRRAWPNQDAKDQPFSDRDREDSLKWGLSLGGHSYTPVLLAQTKLVVFQPVLDSTPAFYETIGLRVALSIP